MSLFNNFISKTQKIIPSIFAVISLYMTFFYTENIIPRPLVDFEFIAKIFALLGIISAYMFRKKIIQYFKIILAFTILVSLLFFIQYSSTVIRIDYFDNESYLVLTGYSYNEKCIKKNFPEIEMDNINDEKLIRSFGLDLDALECIYSNYPILIFIYKLLFISLIYLVIICLGGIIRT